jgi:starvation-inducible DNA-binding protein
LFRGQNKKNKGFFMEINTGIGREHCLKVTTLLNILLADEYVLYTKTLNYHWNVFGPDFKALHIFFQDQYEAMLTIVDDVAERIRSIGDIPHATMTEFMKNTRLAEKTGEVPAPLAMIKNLLDDHESIIRSLRTDLVDCDKKYNDMGTSNFLTDLMEKHEKMAWMLRATLQK